MNQPVLRLMIVAIIFSCPVFGQSSDAPEAAPKEKYRQALGLLTGSATAQADRDRAMSLLPPAAGNGCFGRPPPVTAYRHGTWECSTMDDSGPPPTVRKPHDGIASRPKPAILMRRKSWLTSITRDWAW